MTRIHNTALDRSYDPPMVVYTITVNGFPYCFTVREELDDRLITSYVLYFSTHRLKAHATLKAARRMCITEAKLYNDQANALTAHILRLREKSIYR